MLDSITDLLKKETISLKEQYLHITESWANNYYNLCKTRSTWHEKEWCEFLGLKPRIANERLDSKSQFLTFPEGFYNTPRAKELRRYQDEVRKVTALSLQEYTKKELIRAEKHYEDSISKLAMRLLKKEMNISKISMNTTHIGVNIETIITDGQKTVRAWTIIAEGPVQRPHYRYLVK